MKTGYGVLVFLFREQALDVDFDFLGPFCKLEGRNSLSKELLGFRTVDND